MKVKFLTKMKKWLTTSEHIDNPIDRWLEKKGFQNERGEPTWKTARWIGGYILAAVLLIFGMTTVPAYIGGLYYARTGWHNTEQDWLNHCQWELLRMKERCGPKDQDLKEIIEYVMERYKAIGPWDVMVFPITNHEEGKKVIGRNDPLCPGITIDPWVFGQSYRTGALLLIHEALHDYWPCWGHDHVTPIMDRMENL
jgi:hypothetical protein